MSEVKYGELQAIVELNQIKSYSKNLAQNLAEYGNQSVHNAHTTVVQTILNDVW